MQINLIHSPFVSKCSNINTATCSATCCRRASHEQSSPATDSQRTYRRPGVFLSVILIIEALQLHRKLD